MFETYLPTGNWSPALADLETAFCLDFPVSFPAFPPAILVNMSRNCVNTQTTNTNLFSNWASSKPATKLLRIRPIPALVPNPLDQSETSLQLLVRAVVDWVQWRSHFLRQGPKKWRHGVTGGQFAASFHYLGPGELDSYSFSHPSPTLPFSIPVRWCSNLPLVMCVGAFTLYAMGHIVILYLPPF